MGDGEARSIPPNFKLRHYPKLPMAGSLSAAAGPVPSFGHVARLVGNGPGANIALVASPSRPAFGGTLSICCDGHAWLASGIVPAAGLWIDTAQKALAGMPAGRWTSCHRAGLRLWSRGISFR